MQIKEQPDISGLYVIYTNPEGAIPFARRMLMMWHDGKWTYPASDQRFRDHVYQCAGPIPALILED